MDFNKRFSRGLGHRAQAFKCWKQGICRKPKDHHRHHLVFPSLCLKAMNVMNGDEYLNDLCVMTASLQGAFWW